MAGVADDLRGGLGNELIPVLVEALEGPAGDGIVSLTLPVGGSTEVTWFVTADSAADLGALLLATATEARGL